MMLLLHIFVRADWLRPNESVEISRWSERDPTRPDPIHRTGPTTTASSLISEPPPASVLDQWF